MPENTGRSGRVVTSPDGTELLMTRVFDAPRSLVFAAWTENEHLARWQMAPIGHTVTTEKSDIRTGGSFSICMHGPDGIDRWLKGDYREVVPPERLVFTHCWLGADGKPDKETLVTIIFAARGNQTELTLHQTGFVSSASRDGHNDGWNSAFDRLASYLADLAPRSLR